MRKFSDNDSVYIYYTVDASAGIQLPSDTEVATDNHNFTGWIDARDVERGYCLYFTIDGASNLTVFRIISNTTQAGAGTDNAVKTLTTPTAINAAKETAFLEFVAADITDGDRYITADLNSVAAQTGIVVFVLEKTRYHGAGMSTATQTAAT